MLKLHRRLLRADGRTYTVVGLRPGTDVRFAVNRYHDMWHILSDRHGARVLGRLLWGLTYQRVPDTLVVIDREFLAPTPFEADPAMPIVLAPEPLTVFGAGAARELRRVLPLSAPPEGTVRWRTPGLDAALTDWRAWFAAQPPQRMPGWQNTRHHRDDTTVLSGVLALRAPVQRLREWAVLVSELGRGPDSAGMDYTYLSGDAYSLEMQVFGDFAQRVACAAQARAEVGDAPDASPEVWRERVWERGTLIRRRRNRATRSARSGRT